MSKVILQPSGNKDAREHYADTVLNDISLVDIETHLSKEDFQILEALYPSGKCKVWGVTPGGNNLTKWNRIERGDVTLFSRGGKIYASAVTTHKLHSLSLATELWDFNSKGQTWEYIYFLEELKHHNIPYVDFNRAVGYAENYVIQGFNVLRPEQSLQVLRVFDLESEIFLEEISEEDYDSLVLKLDSLMETESEIITTRRLEQSYLKRNLFGRKVIGTCACCKKDYPISYLVTAHIKKRAFCDLKERKDLKVVMPMCKMGCDDIYEKGYVSVFKGLFVDMKKSPNSKHLEEYISSVIGNKCEYYDSDTEAYFEWHYRINK
jgi:hypothetical protein